MKHIGMLAAVGILLLPLTGVADEHDLKVELGRKISFDPAKGNCLACHMMSGGELPGSVGPPLIQMKERFPKTAVLRRQIWDASAKNPQSIMPPFGKHGILTEQEIDSVVAYMYSL